MGYGLYLRDVYNLAGIYISFGGKFWLEALYPQIWFMISVSCTVQYNMQNEKVFWECFGGKSSSCPLPLSKLNPASW